MKILYINQYFKTPAESGSTRSYWIAKELINNNHEVTMITQSNQLVDGNQQTLIKKITIDGIKVIYVKINYSNSMGAIKRIIAFLKFMVISSFLSLKEKNIDLTYASSTPLTIAVPALIKKWFQKTPFVFEVRDLWPEAPIQLGFIKNKLLIKFLRFIESLTYKNASHVIALSPGMQEGIIKFIPIKKTSIIPNMAKIDKFWPRPKSKSINTEFNLDQNSFKIIYFGTMGIANGIDYLLNGIIELEKKQIENLEFVFLGDGAKKQSIIELSKNFKFVKINYVGRQPMKKVSELVNNSDISICTFSNFPILNTNSPNKLFDSLSAGKPSIVNSPGWTKEIVENFNCGVFANPNDPQDFAEKVLFLKNNPESIIEMGKNARNLAETQFDKTHLCPQIVKILEKIHNEK